MDLQKTEALIRNYLFTEKIPLRDDVIDAMNQRPSLKERGSTAKRITAKILAYVETFINWISGKYSSSEY